LALCALVALGLAQQADGAGRARPAASVTEPDALERLARAAFQYLWEEHDPRTGLVYNTTEPHAPASPTACGVALSAIPIAVERGWIRAEEGYHRAKRLLRSLASAEQERGFFYHFLDARSGARTWQSEVSCIDSSILFAGAIVAGEYFKGTEVERLAQELIRRAQWPWFLDGEDRLQWGWRPESGFDGGPMDFSEAILAYLLALGSPTHPIPADCWRAIRRPITHAVGSERRMVYTADGSLFAYLLPLAWFDLRDRHDAYVDYWANAFSAITSNIRFCERHRARSLTYRMGLWGLSAALGPDGYKAYGAMPALKAVHDGTVAPYVVAASIPWIPDVALATLRRMEGLAPSLWTRYGLGDGVNLDRGFVCPHTIALDQGLVLLMIENARTGLIWDLFMRHPIAQRALAAAGFRPGRLEEPRTPPVTPGNPDDAMTVPMVDHAVSVDGDLREWIRREAIELTPIQRRHVEWGYVRDSADASMVAYIGWTAQRFYVAGIVSDDEVVTRQQGGAIFQDDCVELFWDLDGDGFRFDRNPSDVQLGLSPGGSGATGQLWAWGALDRVPDGVEAALQRGPGRWQFELSVPRSLLPGLTPGRSVRFSVAYHDRDLDGKAAKLVWSIDTASVPGTVLFGRMTMDHER
jgi:hypothetical protein